MLRIGNKINFSELNEECDDDDDDSNYNEFNSGESDGSEDVAESNIYGTEIDGNATSNNGCLNNDELIVKDENEQSNEENNSENDDKTLKNTKIKHNPEWADAMAKILKINKPKRKKSIVLSKAKKLKKVVDDSEETSNTFEIDGESDIKTEFKVENVTKKEEKKTTSSQLEIARRLRKKTIEAKGRVKPSVLDKDREKALVKVATKGVVQLFNAVRQQQRSLEEKIEKVGSSTTKKEKILKSVDKKAFLDVLMGAKSQSVPLVKDEPEVKSEWSVLRDDFMMGTKLKDWDKDENELKDE